jgi:glyoxylase-like metal-dependent hydrolase (beta-lactamase superfamily II)
VNSEDTIYSKLLADGVEPETVKKIILSHAHPDHIGGLNLFQDYQLISTAKVLETLNRGRVLDLVFRNMIPKEKVEFCPVKEFTEEHFLNQYFSKLYDVLGDGSIIGAELNGHAKGQLGIYLSEQKMFLVADACWGKDLLHRIKDMRFIPRRIQNNYREYCETADALLRLSKEHPEIQIIYSHDHN